MAAREERANSSREKKPARYLVIGENSRIVLPIVRSLGRAGAEVHVAWCSGKAPAKRSRYLKHWHSIPVPAGDNSWLSPLTGLLRSIEFDLMIPASDPSAVLIHANRALLEPYVRIALPAIEAFDTVFDKQKTISLARELAIPVPATQVARNQSEARAVAAEMNWPVMVKPLSSSTTSDPFTKQFVRWAKTPEQLGACFDDLQQQPLEMLMLQERVSGQGVGVEILAHQGAVLYAFQHQRLHETSGHGSTYRKSVALCPELLAASEKMVRALDYSGVAMFEFRVDQASGSYYLIEINGRFWGSLALAIAAGANFPAWLADMMLADRRSFPSSYRQDIYARNLFDDVRVMVRRVRPRAIGSKGFDGWNTALDEECSNGMDLWRIFSRSHRFDTFSFDDPLPFFQDLLQLLHFFVRRAGRS